MRCHKKYLSSGLKVFVVLLCLGGFIYQTMVFMFFYWTYPTVVDIQVTSPSYIDMPAFTFCNHIGYNLDEFCDYSPQSCPEPRLLKYAGLCNLSPYLCIDGEIPSDFTVIAYNKYVQLVQFTPEINEKFATKLEKYLTCSIEFAGETRKCNMESIMGSMYSTEDLPHYCFTLYSKWGQPEKKREKIEKGAVMKLHFFLNATQRPEDDEDTHLRFNQPSTAAVQIAVHSPYYLPSPFLLGSGFIAGKSYEIQLKQEEKHLLPAPYQTFCTDYMSTWYARGGKAPINQLTVIQECKMNHSYATRGCVPINVDYPHQYNICLACGNTNECDESTFVRDNCSMLAEKYNQPCDFISYEVEINDKLITIHQILKNPFTRNQEGINEKITSHDCNRQNFGMKECSTIDAEVVFERFEITNLTYNPKYESMEIFSVVGGYLGMWLGVSLVAVYDFISTIIILIKDSCTNKMRNKRRRRQVNRKRVKPSNGLDFEDNRGKLQPSVYNEKPFRIPSNYSKTYHY